MQLDDDNSHTVFLENGWRIDFLSPGNLEKLFGLSVVAHLHIPATKALGRNIYSVLHEGFVLGHAEEITLHSANVIQV